MHIGPSSLISNKEATSNIISAVLLMIIFLGVVLYAISFTTHLLAKALIAVDMQRAKDVLSSLDEAVRTNSEGTLEYRLYNGSLCVEKQRIDLQINYSSNNSIYRTASLNGCTLYYWQAEEYPAPSISYSPEISLQNETTLHLVISEIDHDLVPQPGYHRIRFNSFSENSSHTGDFTVHLIDHQYNRSRYFFNITKVDLEIRKISLWDEEWRR